MTRRLSFISFHLMGNRIAKHIYTDNAFTLLEKSTYYVRDASGNVMAVYDRRIDASEETSEFMLSERHIYGSSRIGMDVSTHVFGPDPYTALTETTRELGRKQYEISNHLGNVLSVITDQKLPVEVGSLIVSYSAVVVTATDYSPFGVGLYGRSWSGEYRYGFGSQEKVDEIVSAGNHYSAVHWEMSPRLAKRWNLDPKPQISISDYAILRNNPIRFTDILGDSSVWDNKGYAVHYDPNDKDLRAFMQDGNNLTLMGTLGGEIDANKWFPNLLKANSEESDDIWNPTTFRDNVKQYGKWDYKYASPANPDPSAKQHILGVAFYRKDKSNGLGDLPETYFNFNGIKGRAEDLNNLHFGVVGNAYGLFSETFMLKQAGSAEMGKWADEGKQVPESWRPIIEVKHKYEFGVWIPDYELGAPYGDNPTDHEWIKKGFKYYNENKSNLDGDSW